jgi:LAGLIDADG endonuclease
LNNNNDFHNYWLAGFSDADASFQIKIINKPNRNKPEIRLNYQVDQKKNDILILIKEFFGGNIGYRKSQDTYYYGSTSFGSANKVVKYFDEYHLQSNKQINYLK